MNMPSITGETRLMGVLGDPIGQIRTPQAINPIFQEKGADIICLPLHIPAGKLQEAWPGLRAIRNLVGFGVTLPHKEAVLSLCDSLDPLAKRVGAVNVVRRERDGELRGYQFDGSGFVRGLETQGITLEGRRVFMIGAGGAALGIAFALHEAGATDLVITNRTQAKAAALVETLNKAVGRSFARAVNGAPQSGDLIVNATSLGLKESDAMPLNQNLIDNTMTVAEVIAKPETTLLLESARERGAVTHSGIHMIHGQVGLIAEHLIELWG